jgi:hypothetical protein
MADESSSVIEALDNIRYVLEYNVPPEVIEYPKVGIGPVEHVLGFSTNEHHVLKEADTQTPYFSNQGVITDLQRRDLPDSKIQTSLRIDTSKLGPVEQWPPEQPPPFDQPPSIHTNTDPLGFSKQAYFFSDGSSFVTVGPSVPKILRLKGGGAHLWVGSVGLIAQGTGKYEGARGISAYTGSAYFSSLPKAPKDLFELLAKGFDVRSAAFFKLVLKADQE